MEEGAKFKSSKRYNCSMAIFRNEGDRYIDVVVEVQMGNSEIGWTSMIQRSLRYKDLSTSGKVCCIGRRASRRSDSHEWQMRVRGGGQEENSKLIVQRLRPHRTTCTLHDAHPDIQSSNATIYNMGIVDQYSLAVCISDSQRDQAKHSLLPDTLQSPQFVSP